VTCCPRACQRSCLVSGPIRLKVENSKLPRTPLFFVKAVTGLVEYFRCMELAKGDELLLPSKAIYTVWQAWLAYDDQFRQERTLLNTFTAENFQRIIPFKAMPDNLGPEHSDVLARTLAVNCELNGLDARQGDIPSLFEIDRLVKMPKGFCFATVAGSSKVSVRLLDSSGMLQGSSRSRSSLQNYGNVVYTKLLEHDTGFINIGNRKMGNEEEKVDENEQFSGSFVDYSSAEAMPEGMLFSFEK